MNVKKYSILITIVIFFLCSIEQLKSDNEGFTEIQKRVISEDRLNIKDRESAIKHFGKINKYFTKPYNIENGKFRNFSCSVPISDDEFKYIVFFPELNSIDVTGNKITDNCIEYIQGQTLLTGLAFTNTSVTGKGIKHLKKLTKLGGLDFQDSPFTDEGCKYLSEIKFEEPISEANFSNTKITDEGIKYLSRIKFNGALMLKNTAITDAGLKYLANQKELGELYLNNTRVTKEGIRWLEKQLPECDIRTKDKDI